MFVAIGGSVECSDDNVLLTQASTVSGGTRFEVVTTRPEIGEAGVIYLVPASNSTTENLYEEWLWVDDKWEQIGSAGLNLSNYAQLTTANTFSADNTFNGNLIKKTSTTTLADNSVLNRAEMDSRYGKLQGGNSWNGTNEFAGIKTTGMISLVANNTAYIKGSNNSITIHGHVTVSNNKSLRADRIETANISGINSLKLQADNSSIDIADNDIILNAATIELDASTVNMADNGMLKFSGRSHITKNVISGIPVLDNDLRKIHLGSQSKHIPSTDNYCVAITPGLHSPYVSSSSIQASHIEVDTISGVKTLNTGDLRINANVSIVGYLGVAGTLTAGSEKNTIDVRANLHMQGKDIKHVYNISAPNGVSLGIKSNIHAYGNNINEADAVKLARLGASSLSAIPGRIDVEGSLHFPSAAGSYVDPDILIANEELRAVDLSMVLGKEDKYGIRITNTSCQLFGIDFAYGDVWSYTNDAIKAQDATPMPGLDSATYFDTVKIKKPAVSIETTGIGALSFDYANEAYIRTFPYDGGQGIFEFQAGNWTSDEHKFIKRGPVDLRKASATELGPTSVLNMEEGDARWGGGSGGVLVDSKLKSSSDTAVTELKAIGDVGPEPAYGIAIGPRVTANVYRDIAIGGWLSTEGGRGDNTLLGYGFAIQGATSNNIIIGHGSATSVYASNTVFIGQTMDATINASSAVAVKGALNGNEAVAINGTAGVRSVAVGSGSFATEQAVAIGAGAVAGLNGTALGTYSIAGENELVLQAGHAPAISMQLYSGTSWETRNNTGYLRFVAARLREDISSASASDRESITIHKKPLWDAIQRAKDYNYPAQPFVSLVGDNGEVPAALANAQPNTIYHIVVGALDINLADMMFDTSIPGIASAELHFEIPSGTTPFIVWPDIMLWPDESDPSVAPTLSGSASGNKLYAIAVRKQITRAGEFLVASIAYSFEY
jgi:hypothetical protein